MKANTSRAIASRRNLESRSYRPAPAIPQVAEVLPVPNLIRGARGVCASKIGQEMGPQIFAPNFSGTAYSAQISSPKPKATIRSNVNPPPCLSGALSTERGAFAWLVPPAIFVRVESPVPGMPRLLWTPFFPTLIDAPRGPSVVLTPDLLKFTRMPGAILIRLLNLSAINQPPKCHTSLVHGSGQSPKKQRARLGNKLAENWSEWLVRMHRARRPEGGLQA